LQCKLYSQSFEIKVSFCIIVGVDSGRPKGSKEKELGVKEEGTRSQVGVMKTEKNESRKKQGHNGT
jgi:hypothetical protein